jgi:hypothetical protein
MQLAKLTNGLCFLTLIVIAGCARTSPGIGNKASVYSEDLSKVRPHYTYVEQKLEKSHVVAQEPSKSTTSKSSPGSLDVTKRLETLLDTLAEQNKAIKYINGFRIQLYVGNIRSEADAAKSYVYTSFEELIPYVTYSQPTYRVKVGDFMYRSDAERYLDEIRQQYSTAVILQDRVEIKNSLQVRAAATQR